MMSSTSKTSTEPLKLHLVRISPDSRAVWLYLLQHNIPVELTDVDILQGEHKEAKFVAMNPHEEVPVLVDGATHLFGGIPILRYLAHKYTNFAGWGKTPEDRSCVQSVLDWVITHLHRSLGYRYVYPQFLDRYQLAGEDTEQLVDKGAVEMSGHLEALENFYLRTQPFLCGAEMTVADSYAACIVLQSEWVDLELNKLWPRVSAWLQRVQGQKHWSEVHAHHNDFVQQLRKCPSWED